MKRFLFLLLLFPFQNLVAQEVDDSVHFKIANAAEGLTKQNVVYDPSYFSIKYPNGDVPADRGVCTDVVIRTLRGIGIDLQKEVHQDMKSNFSLYPKIWGLKSTDRNIDHRRVPNLMTYFKRKGKSIKITDNEEDYKPGDIVAWRLYGSTLHIGMVSTRKHSSGRPLMVHNIGAGQVFEEMLFSYDIIGHYRW